MRKDYRKNLDNIADLGERKLLREILSGVLDELITYDEEMFQKVEERVFGELSYREMNYSITTSIVELERYDPIHECLFPMVEEDVNGIKPSERISVDSKSGEICLGKVFLECEYPYLKDRLEKGEIFEGVLVTNQGEHTIQVKIRKSMDYLKLIILLYHTFLKNGIPWVTVYCPYLFKFVDLIVVQCIPVLEKEEECLSYRLHLRDLEERVHRNRIPLWNVDLYRVQTMNFPVPVLDGVNYEHLIPTKGNRRECGYLIVVPDGISCYMRQTRENIVIITPIDTMQEWEMMRIVPVLKEIDGKGYPLMENRTRNSFTNRLERNGKFIVRTKGELIRMINSFEMAEGIELLEVCICEKVPEKIVTYSVNFFFAEGIREEQYKKCMLLIFQRRKKVSIFDWDQISFLVSEVQLAFPEFYCVGQFSKEE